MTRAPTPQPERADRHPDLWTRAGGWLFSRRTWLPLPIAVLLLLAARAPVPRPLLLAGFATVAGAELLRLWGVRHIGVISRTRSDRLGPLVQTGPFAYVRNPLYLGNLGLWTGFALSAGLPWLAPAIAALLALEYHAIVRWEEQLLTARLGATYEAYAAGVPRWIPAGRKVPIDDRASVANRKSWGDTLFSERGTLIAIAGGYALLWAKSRV
jgi:protein-S-isoprenylcysteine O-methyltransferase Ste14